MRIGIIGAMNEEVETLKNEMFLEEKVEKANMTFYRGVLLDKETVVVTCGIGKVNAAVCTQILIDNFKVDKIINVGIAGGLNKDIYPGDIVVATNLVQHDMDVRFFGDPLGQIPRLDTFDFKCDEDLVKIAKRAIENLEDSKAYTGRIVSGDQFVSVAEHQKFLGEHFDAFACEMEGASIGQVCYLNSMPFVVIRSISDNAINGSHMDYETFAPLAIKNSVAILKDMIRSL
ncbi:5'-methylthioadenosine/adenosylhomocysteine nucleosidase [Acidaminobacter sp. JC074]|uniref:5'-methylthioadenosine/adenosylhomocysteine nucleosidase n=1 Tax=Acidaminobacter sp. JC074 TaxID=2530199 RepID=UPI001F1121EF|nr:5'-methylthioadenosine/adenosylhomocysteine nucleosidase [Acidaminobacter sp. JC074]MCH4890958.1 5'-methylthioadenosine/adenosylhomocysteine nucleosidase [Acidaminobacter sp. JC074]